MTGLTTEDLKRAMQVVAELQSAGLHVEERDRALDRAALNYSFDRCAHYADIAMKIEEQWIAAKAALVAAQESYRQVAHELTAKTGRSMESILAQALDEALRNGERPFLVITGGKEGP